MEGKGLDDSDVIDVINALANIKKQDVEKQAKEEQKTEEIKKKFFAEQEFVIPTREDYFICRDGRTKSGRYFVRIYDGKNKRVVSKSLGTTNRLEALHLAKEPYAETKDKLEKGLSIESITTKEQINICLKQQSKEISEIPHNGMTTGSYDGLIQKSKYWEYYICCHKPTFFGKIVSNETIKTINFKYGK